MANGSVMGYGQPFAGGIPGPSKSDDKWSAVEIYTLRFAFLVTLSGSAILWDDISKYGIVLEKKGCALEQVNSTSCAFTVTWSDGRPLRP